MSKRTVILFASACAVFALLSAVVIILALLRNSAQKKETAPRISLVEGIALPGVSAIGWLEPEGERGEERFVSLGEDGIIRVWELYSGRVVFAAYAAENNNAPDANTDPAAESKKENPVFLSEVEFTKNFPLIGTDGERTLELSPAADGSICLMEGGKELAWYYGFGLNKWASVSAEGFYNASGHESSFLEISAAKKTYKLSQLSSSLFRPDLFAALLLGEKRESPVTFDELFTDEMEPPLVSLSVEGSGQNRILKFLVTEQKGGAGRVALYRRSGGIEEPSGLFMADENTEKKYAENGAVCYEFSASLESVFSGAEEIGVSAFNRKNTLESEKFWLPLYGGKNSTVEVSPQDSERLPVLRALVAAAGEIPRAEPVSLLPEKNEQGEVLAEFLSLQKESALYSGVNVKQLSPENFTPQGFKDALGEICTGADKNDVLVLYIRGAFRPDSFGDLCVVTHNAGGENGETEISAFDIMQPVLNFASPKVFVLLDMETGVAEIETETETAMLRFRQRLGAKAVLAFFGSEGIFLSSIMGTLSHDFANAPAGAFINGNRNVRAHELIDSAVETLSGAGMLKAIRPPEDFILADRFINSGELKFQTMASGMLKIDQVDKDPVPLIFGNTMIRALSPGSYIVDMIYRNGYRETRTVELRKRDSAWVIFTYTPPLLVGDFSRQLPSLGINVSELNPENYEKINKEAMEGMGMAPYYVAFLAGEKFYREGNYDKAITEYNRSISMKADYVEAYVSRGNAFRRKGENNRAVADYTRALDLKSGYAEVYNYRGFVYARDGNLARAIADYTQAIRCRGDYADAYFNRAYAYSRQGNYDSAIADYTQVLKFEPGNAAAYTERGRALLGKGDESGADADFESARRLRQN